MFEQYGGYAVLMIEFVCFVWMLFIWDEGVEARRHFQGFLKECWIKCRSIN